MTDEKLLSLAELARRWGVCTRAVREILRAADAPKPVKLSQRSPRYVPCEITAFELRRQQQQPKAAA